ncbi:DUF5462 family protein [Shewanella frigidimarina]|uniref:DUF5462 family protein n=1 Tax=Shewanella frigidimarina TaxID=56812 RepID=UPI00316AF4C8
MPAMYRHWSYRVIVGLLYLMLGQTHASPVVLNSAVVNVGAVNGTVKGDMLEIEYPLPNPVLLMIEQSQLDGTLKTLFIEQARLIEASGNRLIVQVQRPLNSGASSTSTLDLGMWLDGVKQGVYASQQGDAVALQVHNTFRELSLIVDSPVKMVLPNRFRGDFSLALRYRGN